jgi:hypothetical protein
MWSDEPGQGVFVTPTSYNASATGTIPVMLEDTLGIERVQTDGKGNRRTLKFIQVDSASATVQPGAVLYYSQFKSGTVTTVHGSSEEGLGVAGFGLQVPVLSLSGCGTTASNTTVTVPQVTVGSQTLQVGMGVAGPGILYGTTVTAVGTTTVTLSQAAVATSAAASLDFAANSITPGNRGWMLKKGQIVVTCAAGVNPGQGALVIASATDNAVGSIAAGATVTATSCGITAAAATGSGGTVSILASGLQ